MNIVAVLMRRLGNGHRFTAASFTILLRIHILSILLLRLQD